MTTPLVPPEWIDAPPAPPAAYGLFSVAIGPTSLSEHGAGGGVQYQGDWCGDARLYPAPCDSTPPTKTFDPMDPVTTATPFKVYASLVCGTQTYTPEEMERRVRARLSAQEQAAAEAALWGADAGDPPGILQTLSSTTLADATNVVQGISLLEQQLATCNTGHPGIIHIRPRSAAYLADRHQLWKDGSVWRTQRGNLVSIGDGYSGLGPADEAPTATTDWFFATGRVLVWRSDDVLVPDPRETINKSTNQYNLIAERDYAIAVECCVVAVEVTLA